jgi:hypothetical protein
MQKQIERKELEQNEKMETLLKKGVGEFKFVILKGLEA